MSINNLSPKPFAWPFEKHDVNLVTRVPDCLQDPFVGDDGLLFLIQEWGPEVKAGEVVAVNARLIPAFVDQDALAEEIKDHFEKWRADRDL